MLVVIEQILPADAVRQIRARLMSAGWQDGLATAGSVAAGVKRNQQIAETDPVGIELGQAVLDAIGAHPTFISAALPAKIYPPKFNRYADGGTYGTHVDNAIMQRRQTGDFLRSDLSATLFLTDPDDYEGGELEIETQFGAQRVKLNAGDMVLYPSSSLHQVTPVTKGERVSCFFWLQSMVRSSEHRSLLYDLDTNIQALHADLEPNDPRITALTGLYHNLLRGWATV